MRSDQRPAKSAPELSVDAEPPGTYLGALTVEGFRGVGEPAALPLNPGPGLTLVVGRNGSGKSSFAEAIEVLLTGDNRRWADRAAVWREGLAEPAPRRRDIYECAAFVVEGRGETVVERRVVRRG